MSTPEINLSSLSHGFHRFAQNQPTRCTGSAVCLGSFELQIHAKSPCKSVAAAFRSGKRSNLSYREFGLADWDAEKTLIHADQKENDLRFTCPCTAYTCHGRKCRGAARCKGLRSHLHLRHTVPDGLCQGGASVSVQNHVLVLIPK